jgi:hypothetical protein
MQMVQNLWVILEMEVIMDQELLHLLIELLIKVSGKIIN